MKVAVIGGTGFIGSYVARGLERAGHDVSLLVRAGSESKIPAGNLFRLTTGDLGSADALDRTLQGCEAVVYSVGILRENPKQGVTFESLQFDGVVDTVKAAERCNVARILLMSANGARQPGTPYQETKFRAEKFVQESGLAATVFRPSVVFGNPHGRMEIATQLHRDMVDSPFPALGFHTGLRPEKGRVMMSPVHVEDVAAAVVGALDDDATAGSIVSLGGPESLSWTDMIRCIARAVDRDKWILPFPISAMSAAALFMDWLPFFPVTRDELTMLAEGNTAHCGELETLLGRKAAPFAPDNLAYLRS